MRCPSHIIIDQTKIKEIYKYFQYTNFALRKASSLYAQKKKKIHSNPNIQFMTSYHSPFKNSINNNQTISQGARFEPEKLEKLSYKLFSKDIILKPYNWLWILGIEHNYMEIDRTQMPGILLTFNISKKILLVIIFPPLS